MHSRRPPESRSVKAAAREFREPNKSAPLRKVLGTRASGSLIESILGHYSRKVAC